jgi:hypothetical protein
MCRERLFVEKKAIGPADLKLFHNFGVGLYRIGIRL